MTEAGWAEKAVSKATTCPDGVSVVYAPTVEKLLKAEHARSVRIVLRLMKQAEKEHRLNQYNAMAEVLTALQRGRGGKG